MISDPLTFLLAFAGLFVAIGGYLWQLDKRARELESRVAVLEAGSANPKNGRDDLQSQHEQP